MLTQRLSLRQFPNFLFKSRIVGLLNALFVLCGLCKVVSKTVLEAVTEVAPKTESEAIPKAVPEAVHEAVLKTVPELFSSFSFKSRIVGHFRIMNVSDVSEIVTNIIHDALISMHPEAVPKTNRKIVADVSTNVIPEAVPEVLYKVVVESLI